MSTPSCWRCLARPTNAVALPIRNLAPVAAPHGTAAFSTTTAAANTKAGTPGGSVGLRYRQRTAASATAHKMRSKNITHQKSPLPGERKAWRKRIVLSNNNSLEVAGLEDLSSENIADPEAAGVMRVIPGELVDQLRAVESFKPSQTWPLFRKPSLLVRAETPVLVGKLNGGVDAKKTSRIVVSGERLAGKSMMLLQAAANGFLNDWIVINIPEAQELTTAVTEYAPVPGSEPMQYAQHVYVHKLLQAMAKASGRVLSKYQAAFDHPKLTYPVKAGDSLLELVNSAKEAEQAWPVFAALWAELTTPNAETARPPVLVTVDGIAHIMRMSEYRSAAFELIHAHDLALVRNIVDVLSGKTTFAAGGAVVAATSRGNQPKCLSLELAVNQRLAEQNGTEPPARVAHVKGYDARADEVLKTVEVINIKGVNKAEARSLMEYWAASGLLRETVTELGIASTWMLGGSGVIGEMERAALLSLRPGRA